MMHVQIHKLLILQPWGLLLQWAKVTNLFLYFLKMSLFWLNEIWIAMKQALIKKIIEPLSIVIIWSLIFTLNQLH